MRAIQSTTEIRIARRAMRLAARFGVAVAIGGALLGLIAVAGIR